MRPYCILVSPYFCPLRVKALEEYCNVVIRPGNVPPQNIHDDCLCDVVCVVTGADLVHTKHHSSPVKGLTPENSAEGAVVLTAHLI